MAIIDTRGRRRAYKADVVELFQNPDFMDEISGEKLAGNFSANQAAV